jgi:hypothetical protein
MDILAKGAKAPIAVYPLRGLGTGEDALQLPEHRDVLVSLPSPVAVRCWMLEGKHVGGDVFDGEILKLSKSEAVLRTDGRVAALTNLKISLLAEAGAERPGGDVYVKVLELGKEGALLHFTSVPPEIQAVLDALIAPAP